MKLFANKFLIDFNRYELIIHSTVSVYLFSDNNKLFEAIASKLISKKGIETN